MGCYGSDIDHASAAKLERRKVGGQYIVGRQYEALKPGIHALIMPDAEMDLAAFQQWHLVHAKSLRQLYAHVREAFGISRQECGQDALDCLRRCGHEPPPLDRRLQLLPKWSHDKADKQQV